jgi:membrane protease YdiL (CAAX protease family)
LAFGLKDGLRFLLGPGQAPLLQSLGVVFLMQAGQRWAGELGARPLRAERRRWRRWPWRWLVVSLTAMLAWTLAVVALAPHRLTPDRLEQWLRLGAMSPWLRAPMAIALLTLAPILEECFFRHYVFYRMAVAMTRLGLRQTPAALATIVVTSLLFTIGHMGLIEPLWLKWLQVFVPGLFLGATAWRHGLEAAIALHWAFNGALLALALAHGFQ